MKIQLEHGMATAEYCVGTLGACFIAFWLWRLGSIAGDHNIFQRMIKAVWGNMFEGDNWIWRWLT